jgi:two-component system phosphate regulon response regulator PhoB
MAERHEHVTLLLLSQHNLRGMSIDYEHSARILVVDDEPDLADLVAYHLRDAGHDVVVVGTGMAALTEAQRKRPDLILLDLMLPDLSGTEVCRRLRRQESTRTVPVLMLTAKGEEVDRVVGFEVGADDYVVKPFSPRELVLRVDAILRRAVRTEATDAATEAIETGSLHIDVPRHSVHVEGEEVALTALEFKLLLDLATRMGRVQSRDALLERVWNYTTGVETRTVDTHVKRLREKLGAGAKYIETVRGVGYRMTRGDS